MKIMTIYTLNLRLLTLKAYNTKIRMLKSSAEIVLDPSLYSVDPEQSGLGPHCILQYLC